MVWKPYLVFHKNRCRSWIHRRPYNWGLPLTWEIFKSRVQKNHLCENNVLQGIMPHVKRRSFPVLVIYYVYGELKVRLVSYFDT
jgi:hypothetical protein